MALTSVLTLPSHAVQTKVFQVTRSMTAGTDKAFVLPKNSVIMRFTLSGKASDAGTTATLSVGTTSGSPTEYVSALNVLAAGSGNGVTVLNGVADALDKKLTADTIVYVKYAETGTASTTGGWFLFVEYITLSSNQTGIMQ